MIECRCMQWFNLLWAFMLGASTAMDTLASQACVHSPAAALRIPFDEL
jgi:hypothetical protein